MIVTKEESEGLSVTKVIRYVYEGRDRSGFIEYIG